MKRRAEKTGDKLVFIAYKNTAKATIPLINSTKSNLAGIFARQYRQRPESERKEIIGIRSCGKITLRHDSHLDLPLNPDLPLGKRSIKTFKKLPKIVPAPKIIIGSINATFLLYTMSSGQDSLIVWRYK